MRRRLKSWSINTGFRVVSLTEGVDSNNQGWFTLATILGLQHEQFLKTLGANVMRGLIGNLLDGLSVGDLAYGYGSVAVPGSEDAASWKQSAAADEVRDRRGRSGMGAARSSTGSSPSGGPSSGSFES